MLNQFPFENVTLKHKQVGDYNSKTALYQNFGFVNPGIYSSVVDAFLEISTHLFLTYLSSLRIWNYFRDPLFNVSSHCMFLRKESSLLREIREPVRSYIIDVCSSV